MHHRRQVRFLALLTILAVAAGILVISPAEAASTAVICKNGVCDGQRDPSSVPGSQDRTLQPAFVWTRRIELHVAYNDKMVWANIGNGSMDDEVWLDRTIGGVPDNSLGRTQIPFGSTSWRTQMYWVDSTTTQGVVRACGKAANRSEVACTDWLPECGAGVCDGQDPAGVGGERILQPVWQHFRKIQLHVTYATGGGMAWADLSGGVGNDEVWLDRTFNNGQTHQARLGDTAVPSGQSGWRTWMYSLTGFSKVRACGKAWDRVEIACTQWLPVCRGTVCDGLDPAGMAERSVNPVGWVWYRRVTLHMTFNNQRVWGSIENGEPGDEVWIERSFSGPVDGTGTLGRTATPPGQRGWRTWAFEFEDSSRGLTAVVRACGKANGATEVGCTPWVRQTDSEGNMHNSAVDILMMGRNPATGLWGPDLGDGIWLSANAFTALIDYMVRTGDRRYINVIADTYAKFPSGVPPHRAASTFFDDYGWWALAWLRAFDLTGDTRYRTAAEGIADQIRAWWTPDCGGGIRWQHPGNDDNGGLFDKNAITNALYLKLTAGLHRRGAGGGRWLTEANREWDWLRNGPGNLLLGTSPRLLRDTIVGFGGECVYKNTNTYTYMQGVMASGLRELYLVTGNISYLDWGISIGNLVTSQLVSGGVVYYPPEELDNDGLRGDPANRFPSDDSAFKGALVRNMREVRDAAAAAGRPVNWNGFFNAQVTALVQSGRSGWAEFGKHWAGPVKFPSYITFASQQSAVDAFTAVHGL